MRISTPYQFESYLSNIRNAHTAYFKTQNQLATGKRFDRSSEDPLSATQSLDTRRLLSRFEQLDKNLLGAKDYLANSESSLTEVTTLMRQAYTLAVQGASDTVDSASRIALGNEVREIQKRIVSLGNSQGAGGQYIFGGTKSETKPFTDDGTTLTFDGDDLPILAETRPAEYMKTNIDGPEALFRGLYDSLTSLRSNLMNGDVIALSSTNVGELQEQVDQVVQVRGEIGNKLTTVDGLEQANQRRIDDLTEGVSKLEDIDFAETYVRYSEAQNAYQAALQVASQGMNLSLMDFMR